MTEKKVIAEIFVKYVGICMLSVVAYKALTFYSMPISSPVMAHEKCMKEFQDLHEARYLGMKESEIRSQSEYWYCVYSNIEDNTNNKD
ncbi:hypothetical protein SteCoe_5787 [Stentor coeruleus]|uniref:Uncharacterized protein n=1 Tax=Stentor coeruleus TaxID=5963 RepID=A0A1R2CRL5_9CILI|nr:hypothetical protein SteCoe_5787 [Stentor coeruleus]